MTQPMKTVSRTLLITSFGLSLQGCLPSETSFESASSAKEAPAPSQEPSGPVAPKQISLNRTSNACEKRHLASFSVDSNLKVSRIEQRAALRRANGTLIVAADLIEKPVLLRAAAGSDVLSEISLNPIPTSFASTTLVESKDGTLYLTASLTDHQKWPLVAEDYQAAVFRSTDDGASWSPVYAGKGVIRTLTLDPNGNPVFLIESYYTPRPSSIAFDYGTVLTSEDQGTTWLRFGGTDKPNYFSMKFAPDDYGLFWFGTLTPYGKNRRFDIFRGNNPGTHEIGTSRLPNTDITGQQFIDIEFDTAGNLVIAYVHFTGWGTENTNQNSQPKPELNRMRFSRTGTLLSHEYSNMLQQVVNGSLRNPRIIILQDSSVFYTVAGQSHETELQPGTYWLPPKAKNPTAVLRVLAHGPGAQVFKNATEDVFLLTPNSIYPKAENPLQLELQQIICK